MRHWFADRLAMESSGLPRVLTSVLVAAAILATPIPYAAAQGVSLLHHLPRKPVVKTRTMLASSARSSSTSGSAIRPRTAKRFSTLSTCAFTAGPSLTFAGLQRVFCPLRC